MNRRSFLTGLLSLAGAATAVTALVPEAQAAEPMSLLDELKNIDAHSDQTAEADVPAEGATETQIYIQTRPRTVRRPVVRRSTVVRRPVVRVVPRRPRTRCVWVRSRSGRMTRRCYTY
jgi:hypothetical protein